MVTLIHYHNKTCVQLLIEFQFTPQVQLLIEIYSIMTWCYHNEEMAACLCCTVPLPSQVLWVKPEGLTMLLVFLAFCLPEM